MIIHYVIKIFKFAVVKKEVNIDKNCLSANQSIIMPNSNLKGIINLLSINHLMNIRLYKEVKWDYL